MEKRLKFRCWKCERIYSLFMEFTAGQQLLVACPFCAAEAVADLDPIPKQTIQVMKGDQETQPTVHIELQLPEILPTKPRQ